MTLPKYYSWSSLFWETAPMLGYIVFQIAFTQDKLVASRIDREVSLLI